jgi:RNA polymerase sigma-70 factor (ECF subfamily)
MGMRSVILAEPPTIDLVAETRLGSSEALAALYREHAGPLLRSLRFLLQDQADAEDVVHDLFVGLPEALGRYEDRGSLRAWLGRTAMRMALTRLRTRKRRREVALDLGASLSRRAEGEQLPDRLLVEQALATLPEPMRTVVVLRDLEGWPYAEIAGLLGASTNTIMTRHCRAMQRLKTALEEIR